LNRTAAATQATEALQLERQLSDVVNEAYGLTPVEVAPPLANRPTPDAAGGTIALGRTQE
jgi:hypothetical protein